MKDFVVTRNQAQARDSSKWKAKYPEEYEHLVQKKNEKLDSPDNVINPPLASISMSASSESDDEKPESKSLEVGGSEAHPIRIMKITLLSTRLSALAMAFPLPILRIVILGIVKG